MGRRSRLPSIPPDIGQYGSILFPASFTFRRFDLQSIGHLVQTFRRPNARPYGGRPASDPIGEAAGPFSVRVRGKHHTFAVRILPLFESGSIRQACILIARNEKAAGVSQRLKRVRLAISTRQYIRGRTKLRASRLNHSAGEA